MSILPGEQETTDGQNDSHLRCIDRNSRMIIKMIYMDYYANNLNCKLIKL